MKLQPPAKPAPLPEVYFQPLRDRILILQEPAAAFYDSGLLVKTDSTQEPPSIGVVLAIGDGRVAAHGEIVPLAVCIGDRVHFKRHSSLPVAVRLPDGKYENVVMIDKQKRNFLIVREDDILGLDPPAK